MNWRKLKSVDLENKVGKLWGVIFGMKKIKLELVMIFESYIKGFIDCHAIIGIQSISILKSILENYEYKIDLTSMMDNIIFWDGCANTN